RVRLVLRSRGRVGRSVVGRKAQTALIAMSVTPVYDAEGALNADLVKLYDFFGALRARLLLITCISLIFGAALTAAAFLMTPVYRGFAILAPVTSDTNPLTGSLGGSPLGAIGGNLLTLTGG